MRRVQFADIDGGRFASLTPEVGTALNPNVITSLLLNGTPSTNTALGTLLYNDAYQATYDTQMWGTEANFIATPELPGPIRWSPMVGFRYLNFDENLRQTGSLVESGVVTETSRIISRGNNNYYGPQAGGQVEIVHKRFTLSALARVAFTLNNYLGIVQQDVAGTANDRVERNEEVDFSSIFQLSGNARIHVNPNFSLFGGYDILWLHRTARAHEIIDYNSSRTGLTLNPDIGFEDDLEGVFIHGFSIGGEVRY